MNVVCLNVISEPHQRGGIGPLGLSSHDKKQISGYFNVQADGIHRCQGALKCRISSLPRRLVQREGDVIQPLLVAWT